MTIQSKSYMNFLGGEVSPNVYKRLDMANNGKWFETAKNAYFGTTGDFYNRRGFQRVNNSSRISGEVLKLIPFIFNKDQSYCIEFATDSFRILKNGAYLRDVSDDIIEISHEGFSLTSNTDLSYVQTGDVLYICGSGNKTYTITRHAEDDWRWGEFEYEIPPMRKINSDKEKNLTFAAAESYSNSGYFSADLRGDTGAFVKPAVDLIVEGVRTTVYSSNSTFSTIDDFISDFNTNLDADAVIASAKRSGTNVLFYLKSGNSFATCFDLRVKLDIGSAIQRTYSYNEGFPKYTTPNYGNPYHEYEKISDSYNRAPEIFKIKLRRFKQYIQIPLQEGATPTNYWDYDFDYSASPVSPATAVQNYKNTVGSWEANGFDYSTYSGGFNSNVLSDSMNNYYGTYLLSLTTAFTSTAVEYIPSTQNILPDRNIYSVVASFDFFADKEVGEIFAIDSIYSPNQNGKDGENKTYSLTVSTGTTITPAFWSNGNWRFVNSGLFNGTIELQYSYDGTEWFTHRTFASTIRSEGGVSYGTNYNEYGTIDVDDNVLLRLEMTISAATNLRVNFDTESFKNRSYYKIIEKDSTYPDTQAKVSCVKYPIGTPGITKYDNTTSSYIINPVYEWAESAWNDRYGYPDICFYYQNRLSFASTKKDPQTIWFSLTDNFKDFSTKVEVKDDDPITISVLKSNGVSDISWITATKKLFVFGADSEFAIRDDGALTQANKELINFTAYGSEPIETRLVSNRVLFVERGGRAVRALTYDYTQENYEAPDLTIPFKHMLSNERIIASEYIPGDYKMYLMLTSAGRILCFKYIPEQKIEACSWFRHAVGNFDNICVVNNSSNFDLYVSVVIDGIRYIEVMSIVPYASGLYLDSFKNYVEETPFSSITDADYILDDTEYTVIIDNIKYKIKAEENTLTLPIETTSAVVGFPYVSECTLIEPNLLGQNGTTNYNRKNMFKAHFEFIDSCGFKVGIKNKKNGFKKVYALEAPSIEGQHKLYSDSRSFALQSSYLEPNMLSFVQEEPYPMHIVNAEVEVDYGGK